MTGADDRSRFARLQELFHELVDLESAERSRRLEGIRREEPELLDELTVLLGDAPRAGGELEARERALDQLAESPEVALESGESASTDASMAPGRRVGPYRVVREIGRGGMGRVYEAEQTEVLVRRVALKVLRPGLASDEILARFEGERQALAVMDHPSIARIVDAGATEDGTPWFAMELVDGVDIIRWADEHELDLDSRIELLLPVCDAVQHAHLKGVIHRDLKPSNILVTRGDDGRPVPKVIDFGISKAIEQPILARTLATRFGELVGTPEYMSPEQATLGAVDIDTRSDVYSLGLVLYELLIGELPLPLDELRGLAFDEICRRIREDDTPRPSTQLRRLAAVTRPPAARPATPTTARSWSRRVRDDLDAVLLKALAKDRDRRYESAAALAGDLQRFLHDEAVEAAPPSWSYRAGKFVRRHRVSVAMIGIAVLSLVAGLVGATLGLLEARRAEKEAVAARAEAETALRTSEETTGFVVGLFEAADPRENPGLDLTARSLLDRGIERIDELETEPGVQARLLETLGDVSWSLGAYDRAEPLLEQALELRTEAAPDAARQARTLDRLGVLYRDRAENQRAEATHRRAIAVLEEAGLGESSEMAQVANNLGIVLSREGRFEEATRELERAIALTEGTEEQPSESVATSLANLGALYHRMGDPKQSLDASKRSLALFEQLLPPDHPNLAVIEINIAMASRTMGDLGEAFRASTRAVEIDRATLPADHPGLADDLHGLGAVALRLGRFDEARAAFTEGLQIINRVLGEDNFRTTLHRGSLGNVALAEGNPILALSYLEPVLDLLARSGDTRAPRHAIGYLRQKVLALRLMGRSDEAAAAIARGDELIDQLNRDVERPSFRLLGALVALDHGDQQRATSLFDEAVTLAGCTLDAPCLLDLADTGVLRAHWYARRDTIDPAFQTLELAIGHSQWTGWMLQNPNLEPLRRPKYQTAWHELEELLRSRMETAGR